MRIQCHGVNELIDAASFRHFYIRGFAEKWDVAGVLSNGEEVIFVPENPQRKEEAEELLNAFTQAIITIDPTYKDPIRVTG